MGSISIFMKLSLILFRWSDDLKSQFERQRRLELRRFSRNHLLVPPSVDSADAYNELLGMDVKLQARISKSAYRRHWPTLAAANPIWRRRPGNIGLMFWLSIFRSQTFLFAKWLHLPQTLAPSLDVPLEIDE